MAISVSSAMRSGTESASSGRLATLARATGISDDFNDSAAADQFVVRITELGQSLGVPRTLGALNVKGDLVPALVTGSRGNSMSGNPRDLSDAELHELLEAML